MKEILKILILFLAIYPYNAKGQTGGEFLPVAPTGIPYSIIIADITLNNNSLPVSSEIAVFDDTLCVGLVNYSGNINQQLVAWQGDQSLGLSGYTFGNPMIFKVRLLLNNDYYIINALPTFIQGTGTFGYGSYTVVNLSVTEDITSINKMDKGINPFAYPNPFNSSTVVDFHQEKFEIIRIYDQKGSIVLDRQLNENTGQFIWDGKDKIGSKVSDGMYLIILSSDKSNKSIKVISQSEL